MRNTNKVCALDLFGTIVEKESFDYFAGIDYLSETYLHADKNKVHEACLIFRSTRMNETPDFKETSFKDQLIYLAQEFNITYPKSLEEIEIEVFEIMRTDKLPEGIVETLENLKANGYMLVVMSNTIFSANTIRNHLNNLSIGHFFSLIFTSGDFGYKKPSPLYFDFVKKQANYSDENINYFIGNDLEKDIIPAKEAGFNTIFRNPENIPYTGDQFTNYDELKNENQNAANRNSFAGDIFNFGSEFYKRYSLQKFPEKLQKLHLEGFIHIHDLDAHGRTYNCLGIEWLKNFPYGKIKKLKNDTDKIVSIFRHIKQLIEKLGNEQSGGISFTDFDNEFAEILNRCGIELTPANRELIKADFHDLIEWNCNCHERLGQVSYYVTFNIGLAASEKAEFIAYTLLDQFENAGADVFKPNIVLKVKKGINSNPNDRNYYLFMKSLSCTAKKMIPTYLLCDSESNREFNPNKIGIMGCRTRVVKDRFGKTGSNGRGNICNVSMNLPRLAYESSSKEEFFAKLKNLMDSVSTILLERYSLTVQRKITDFPVNLENDLWCEDFSTANNLEQIFKHGTLSIGFIGLSDCVYILSGKRYYEDSDADSLAYEIVETMRNYCDQKAEETNTNFTLLATSGEMISGKFPTLDKKFHPDKSLDVEFYTNSFHVDVYSGLNPFEKIKAEGKFHKLTNGGSITYVELDSTAMGNEKALETMIQYATEQGVNYLGFNFPLDICNCCGASGIFSTQCPMCSSKNLRRIRRVSGYLEELSGFSVGKKAEEKYRIPNVNFLGGKKCI